MREKKFKYPSGNKLPSILFDTPSGKFFISSTECRIIEEISEVDEFLYYILDTTSSSEPGIYTVTGAYKYAEILAKKKLEERGEITPEETFLIYHKKKEDKTKTTILYNLLPSNTYENLKRQYLSFPWGMIAFDDIGIACGYLKSIARDKPVCIICEAISSTVMVIGKKGTFFLIRRYGKEGILTFSQEDTSSLIEQDILGFEKDTGINIKEVIWCPICVIGKEMEVPNFDSFKLVTLPHVKKDIGETVLYTSVPYIIKSISKNYSLFGKEEKWIRPLERGEKYLWGGLFFVSGILFLIFLFFLNIQRQLEAKSQSLSHTIWAYEQSLNYFSQKIKKGEKGRDYKKLLSFSKDLVRSQEAPSYGFFWKLLDKIRPKGIYLTEMDIHYGKASARLSLIGEIPDTMMQAQQSFSSLLYRLNKAGFKIEEQNINLGLGSSSFLVTLVYKYRQNIKDRLN